jgi:hypothetical protein
MCEQQLVAKIIMGYYRYGIVGQANGTLAIATGLRAQLIARARGEACGHVVVTKYWSRTIYMRASSPEGVGRLACGDAAPSLSGTILPITSRRDATRLWTRRRKKRERVSDY